MSLTLIDKDIYYGFPFTYKIYEWLSKIYENQFARNLQFSGKFLAVICYYAKPSIAIYRNK